MRKFALLMSSLFLITTSSQAMSYEQAREQALFLTDKMAYELNLTEDQYEACYEINLDYLMGISSQDDIYSTCWTQRNLDISYILLDWQYQLFLEATYFYRPIYWLDGLWHFAIYARYPSRNYFYFGRPAFWSTYRGGHSWRLNGGKSWYAGRSYGGKGTGYSNRNTSVSSGMRDKFNQGAYGRGQTITSTANKGRVESNGQSSTRLTAGSGGAGVSGNSRPGSGSSAGGNNRPGSTNTQNGSGTTVRPSSANKPSSSVSAATNTGTIRPSTSANKTTSTITGNTTSSSSKQSTSSVRPSTSSSKTSSTSVSSRKTTTTSAPTSVNKTTSTMSTNRSSAATRTSTSSSKSSSSISSSHSSGVSKSSSTRSTSAKTSSSRSGNSSSSRSGRK